MMIRLAKRFIYHRTKKSHLRSVRSVWEIEDYLYRFCWITARILATQDVQIFPFFFVLLVVAASELFCSANRGTFPGIPNKTEI